MPSQSMISSQASSQPMSQFSWQSHSQRDSTLSHQRDSQQPLPPSSPSPSVQHSQQQQQPQSQTQQSQPQSQAQQPLSDHSISSSSVAGDVENSIVSLNNSQAQVQQEESNPPQPEQDGVEDQAGNEPDADAVADANGGANADDDRDSVLDD